MPSKYIDCILGNKPLPNDSHIVMKSGYITREDVSFKGMGRASGGEWKPSKKEDERFLGKPRQKIKTRLETSKGGYDVETKIGDDGKATKERHYTDHRSRRPQKHSNPHDHDIDWSKGVPKPSSPRNYPGGAPEFKNYKERKNMSNVMSLYNPEENRFKSISDFKWCVDADAEIEIVYLDKFYGIFS